MESRPSWRAWLEEHHTRTAGVWVVTWKKASGGPHVPRRDVVEEALCFGWVDSLPRTLDGDRSMLLVAPRKPGSSWSRVNKELVLSLTERGLMAPAGLAAVEEARRRGTWTALDAVEDLLEPPDLAAALDAVPEARAYWDGFPRSTRRAILEWVGAARREQTRQTRIADTVAKARENIRANQWRQPGGR